MIKFFKKIRFYLRNAIWNYWFWLNCKRKFVEYSFIKKNPINNKREKIVKRRFVGYEYKGKTYIDNPGIPLKNKDEWDIIKKSYK
jgi:hypothetical protein